MNFAERQFHEIILLRRVHRAVLYLCLLSGIWVWQTQQDYNAGNGIILSLKSSAGQFSQAIRGGAKCGPKIPWGHEMGSSRPIDLVTSSMRRLLLGQIQQSMTVGIINEDGSLNDEFINVGNFGDDEKDWDDDLFPSDSRNSSDASRSNQKPAVVQTYKFKICPPKMKDYIPCLDDLTLLQNLPNTSQRKKWERQCPHRGSKIFCVIATPNGYKTSIRWPRSKDEMVPALAFGVRTRTALDVGCGVASFGAALLARDVLALSIAPKDVHKNEVQFALERGVPAMVAVLAARRLVYPSQAFDLVHCSDCDIGWTRDGGTSFAEVNRLLRAGGYFAWAAPFHFNHDNGHKETWHAMEKLASCLCWTLVAKEGYIAVFQKPYDNSCYQNRSPGTLPPMCDESDDPDAV